MKKKIALFANGWSSDYLTMVLSGIQKCAREENLDLFLFVNYTAKNDTNENNEGENNIFRLPKLENFDGAVVFGNIIKFDHTVNELTESIRKAGIPAISLERELPGMDYMGACNYPGMYELAEHLVVKHRVKNAVFIGGPESQPESRERLQAVRDAFQKHGIDIPESSVYYGDFTYAAAVSLTKQILQEHGKKLDAVICANDHSAMGAVVALEQAGLKIPEQIIVTGFDGVEKAQIFSPSITTVERDWDQMGYRCIRHLLKQIEGQDISHQEMLHTRLAKAESCGCGINRENLNRRIQFCREGFQSEMESITLEWSINEMEQKLTEIHKIEELYTLAESYFQTNHELFGENCFFVGEKSFQQSIYDADISLRQKGYSEDMQVLLAMKHGEIQSCQNFKSAMLVPGYDGEDAESHIYTFLPVHHHEKTFGYAVFEDNLELISNQRMFIFMYRLGQNLESFRLRGMLEAQKKD